MRREREGWWIRTRKVDSLVIGGRPQVSPTAGHKVGGQHNRERTKCDGRMSIPLKTHALTRIPYPYAYCLGEDLPSHIFYPLLAACTHGSGIIPDQGTSQIPPRRVPRHHGSHPPTTLASAPRSKLPVPFTTGRARGE